MRALFVAFIIATLPIAANAETASVRPVSLSKPRVSVPETTSAVYANTGIIFSERTNDQSLTKATGTVVKTMGGNYSILTVKHAIFDKNGNRFASRLIFTTEEKPSRPPFIIDISHWVEKIEPFSDKEDFFFIPIKKEDAEYLGATGVTLSFPPNINEPFFTISSRYDKENARIDKSIHKDIEILAIGEDDKPKTLNATNISMKTGMCGASLFQKGRKDKLVFLGILGSDCDCDAQNICTGTIVRP